MKVVKKILWVLLAGLIVIQFIHPKKNKAEGPQPNYIGTKFAVPQDVQAILKIACNDCHSNNTRYPWYARFQPVHWWLNKHIVKGKDELNFDEYANKSLRYQYHKMKETVDMVKKGEMPLNSYTWTHKDARLSDTEKDKIITWAGSILDSMKAHYPMDSLERKRKK
ncbi:MAG: heme-binding domain-containing protein [Chitinophagaceae bacterium]|nr:heme-binding domain-containing protein [Chitinophagaceae bacterium]MCB0739991.1 heme-binding domain-containing protein [Chitinophagaceae bacterium]HQV05528.1 heme-binding domain-containing protein [Chitinophagaceae bacterium]